MSGTLQRLITQFVFMNTLLIGLSAQIPYVYDVENTGDTFAVPPLPALADCQNIGLFPDPFAWANDPLGSTRSTAFSDWSHHRAEIIKQFEFYEIGTKPVVDTSQISASYSDDTLKVVVTVDGRKLTLTSVFKLPAGAGPFPALISMNFSGLPVNDFTSRNIVQIRYNHDQVTTYDNPSNSNPYYQLYPDLNIDNTGQYSAWAWGVSRLIDGLYKLKDSLPIDLEHIAVTGCSYAGKMALFSGALDERIALTIAQESGGGGATAWRYSYTLSGVEGLGQTSHQWFSEDMFDFGGSNVFKLPIDHHLLMALCAPRALYVTGNTDYLWLANPSCYVASRAVQQIYDTLGVGDRFGFGVDGGHAHCGFPTAFEPDLDYFLDKFMLGNTALMDTIEVYPESYSTIDYAKWYNWWGTGKSAFPYAMAGANKTVVDTFGTGVYVTLNGSGSIDPGGTISSYVWKDGNTQISTEVKPTLLFTLGVHNITLTITDVDGATSTDDIIVTVKEYITSDIQDIDNAGKNLVVYPNPVNDYLHVNLAGSSSVIGLYNYGGQKLLELSTEKSYLDINMADYSPGIYIMKITLPEKTITKKIIRN